MNLRHAELAILEFLHKIESGQISLKPLINPNKVYSGDVRYNASNGWEIVVFNDANSWDYLDYIKMDESNIFEFEELDQMLTIRNYCPPIDVIKEVYGISQDD